MYWFTYSPRAGWASLVRLGPVLKYCHRDLSLGLLCLSVSFASSFCGLISSYYQLQRKTKHVFLVSTSLCAVLELISVDTGPKIRCYSKTIRDPPELGLESIPWKPHDWQIVEGGFPKDILDSLSQRKLWISWTSWINGCWTKQQVFITEHFWHDPQNKSVVTGPRMSLRILIMCHFLFILLLQQYVFIYWSIELYYRTVVHLDSLPFVSEISPTVLSFTPIHTETNTY